MKKQFLFAGLAVSALVTSVVACGNNYRDETGTTGGNLGQSATLNTRIAGYLEIDQANVNGPEDANLVLGNDGNSDSYPGPGTTTLDWTDLGGQIDNHRLLDLNDSKGRDPSSFPRSNECVGPSQVLSKMDLTYVASANNSEYAYFAVQRSDNNGDAGYYWVFTKKAPKQLAGAAPCKAGETRLLYDVSVGDVLLAGHFKPNGTPLLRVFKAKADQNDVTAVSAVDFTNAALWLEDAPSLQRVAVNTTTTPPGSFGSAGVGAMVGGMLGTELFAEAAVNLALFTGGGNSCGATYYGSVITRSSGSGGTSPDLKDLAGPALFNFGSAKAVATLTGSCGNGVHYKATGTAADGTPLANPTCSWSFDGGASNPGPCEGDAPLGPGSHTATVTLTDPTSNCSDTQTTAAATVFSPVGIKIELTGAPQTCAGGMTSDAATFKATVDGGSGQSSIVWNVTGAGPCSGDTCTIDPADTTFCAAATVSATVNDTVCGSATTPKQKYSKVTTVTVAPE